MKPNRPIYIICFCLLIFNVIGNTVSAQKFLYSDASGNFSVTRTKVIGLVKNNIIVWQYVLTNDYDLRKSKILVYNNRMELLHTTSFTFLTPKLFSIEFTNQTNTFSAVIQYKENNFLVCKLISFDANGNVLKNQTIEDSTDVKDGNYDVRSGKDGSLVLFKLLSYNNDAITLQYHFIKNDEVKHSGNITLPFDTLSSVISKIFLDDNQILIPLINTKDSSSTLLIYKINLLNDSSINTLRNLNTGALVSPSINMAKNGNYYTVVSLCENANFYTGDRVFYWKLNNDLTDVQTDTVFTDSSSCLRNLNYSRLNVFGFNNNTSNVVLSPFRNRDNSSENVNYFSRPSYDVSLPPTMGGSFYEGRITSMTPQRDLNGNGYAYQSNVYQGPTWYQKNYTNTNSRYAKPGKNFKQKNMLVFMNIADKNKLNWMQCFSEKIGDEILSTVNEIFYANSGNALHIIYSVSIKKNKQTLGDIIINSDGSHIIEPIISTNLRYEYFIGQSFQLDKNSILIPCNYRGKTAFAKLTF